jgi:hypothetical protein
VGALGKKLGWGHLLSHRTDLPSLTWTTAVNKELGNLVTPAVMDVRFEMWGEVSGALQSRYQNGLEWTDSAAERFDRVPDFMRGQVREAVDGNARTMGASAVDDEVVDKVTERWATSGDFHEGHYGFRWGGGRWAG